MRIIRLIRSIEVSIHRTYTRWLWVNEAGYATMQIGKLLICWPTNSR